MDNEFSTRGRIDVIITAAIKSRDELGSDKETKGGNRELHIVYFELMLFRRLARLFLDFLKEEKEGESSCYL